MTPHWVKYCSLSFLPATFLSISFEALFNALKILPLALLQRMQGHCQASGKGPSPPGHCQEQLTQIQDCLFVKTHIFTHDP